MHRIRRRWRSRLAALVPGGCASVQWDTSWPERRPLGADLARFATEVDRRRAAVDFEKSQRIPDVTVAAGVRRFSTTDDTAVVFGFELPLPMYDRNEGGILAARYELARAEEERRAARLRVLTRLAAADDRLQGAWREVVSLREQVLPDAEEVHRQILAEFDAGHYAYDDVLDAQRTLFRLRGQYLEALERYHVAVAEVERLIGEPPHGTPWPRGVRDRRCRSVREISA